MTANYPNPGEHRDYVAGAPRWNPETADEYIVEKELCFSWGPIKRRLVVKMPLYILKTLRSYDWDHVHLEGYREGVRALESARASGLTPDQALAFVAKWVRERIYDRFCRYQERTGNESWIVPASLQPEFFEHMHRGIRTA